MLTEAKDCNEPYYAIRPLSLSEQSDECVVVKAGPKPTLKLFSFSSCNFTKAAFNRDNKTVVQHDQDAGKTGPK